MISILVAILVILFVSLYLSNARNDVLEFVGIIGVCVGLCILVVYCFVSWNYFAAEYKKDIINREYKTNYTQEEVFYASDVIETVRELNRKRIEVNGDLLKDK
jgi:hypothetical protein